MLMPLLPCFNVQLTDSTTTQNHIKTTDIDQERMVSFDILRYWFSDPVPAFEQWMSSTLIKPSTLNVKRSMWGKFCRWMNQNNISISDCLSEHIRTFFDDEEIKKEHRRRYIKLIESIYEHLRQIGLNIPQNPGRDASYKRMGKGRNDDMKFFGQKETEQIIECLRSFWLLGNTNKTSARWQIKRDTAIIGLVLGGGLRVNEVGEMSVNCTLNKGVLYVESLGDVMAHFAELLPIGIEALDAWLPVRSTLKISGDVLFPPDVTRRPHGVSAAPIILDHSNIYRRVNRMLKAFGITGKRITPQTLRNTYAGSLIKEGWGNTRIMSSMGLVEDTTVHHIRNNYKMSVQRL